MEAALAQLLSKEQLEGAEKDGCASEAVSEGEDQEEGEGDDEGQVAGADEEKGGDCSQDSEIDRPGDQKDDKDENEAQVKDAKDCLVEGGKENEKPGEVQCVSEEAAQAVGSPELEEQQCKILYREPFSKGLHWLQIEKNENSTFLLGHRAAARAKAVQLS